MREQAGAELCQVKVGVIVVVVFGVEVEQDVAVVNYTFLDGRTADGRVEMIIMLYQLLDVVVVEAGAELGNVRSI